MKPTTRRKPKFKVGQVVATREPNPSFFKIKSIFYDRFENICYDLHTMAEWSEGELRSLTAREKG